MKRIVFAGPSLPPGKGPEGIEIRAPARKGDLLIAARDGAAIIGLVDGFFETAPSVWHKEILFCISRGIVVAGAASMGALRAAECAAFGMIGIGRIFREYHDGTRTADADVAVLHAPAELGHAALSLALVDAEVTVERMLAAGAISDAEAAAVLQAARELHFKDRSWDSILAALKGPAMLADRLRELLPGFRADQKRDDCQELLQFVRDHPLRPLPPRFELQRSAFLTELLRALERPATETR